MFVAKIVQTEGKKPSLLEFYAEVQPILYKDTLILGVLQLSDAKLRIRYAIFLRSMLNLHELFRT